MAEGRAEGGRVTTEMKHERLNKWKSGTTWVTDIELDVDGQKGYVKFISAVSEGTSSDFRMSSRRKGALRLLSQTN